MFVLVEFYKVYNFIYNIHHYILAIERYVCHSKSTSYDQQNQDYSITIATPFFCTGPAALSTGHKKKPDPMEGGNRGQA
jgi:hypothetical protein